MIQNQRMKKPNISKEKFAQSNEITELWRGQSLELLKALHIITRDGKLNADSRRKLKQVYHLVQFIEPLIQQIHCKNANFSIVDVGAGKSYLGFILYDLVLRELGSGKIISVESRPELVTSASALAKLSGFDRMEFISSKIEDAPLKNPVQMVCALHACDTATDDAILLGLRTDADVFVLVPCCQAEVARQLGENKTAGDLEGLWRFPIHKREFGSHLTNVLRVLFLESLGYKVTVTELVGFEHSMKNELIIAEKPAGGLKPNKRSLEQLKKLLAETGVKPKLLSNFKL